MTTYVALLRGINVGGNILKMERLREICTKLGMKNARTYIQSGNLVFDADKSSSHWVEALEKKLAGESRLPVSVIVRTATEIATISKSNPFLKEKGIDIARLGVTFLQQPPTKEALTAVSSLDLGTDRFHCAGKDIYIHCAGGFAGSKLYALDKVLKQKTTTRNWNTVKRLHEMCES